MLNSFKKIKNLFKSDKDKLRELYNNHVANYLDITQQQVSLSTLYTGKVLELKNLELENLKIDIVESLDILRAGTPNFIDSSEDKFKMTRFPESRGRLILSTIGHNELTDNPDVNEKRMFENTYFPKEVYDLIHGEKVQKIKESKLKKFVKQPLLKRELDILLYKRKEFLKTQDIVIEDNIPVPDWLFQFIIFVIYAEEKTLYSSSYEYINLFSELTEKFKKDIVIFNYQRNLYE